MKRARFLQEEHFVSKENKKEKVQVFCHKGNTLKSQTVSLLQSSNCNKHSFNCKRVTNQVFNHYG